MLILTLLTIWWIIATVLFFNIGNDSAIVFTVFYLFLAGYILDKKYSSDFYSPENVDKNDEKIDLSNHYKDY